MPTILYDKWHRYNHYNIPEMAADVNAPASPVNYITNVENLTYYLQHYNQSKFNQRNAQSLGLYQYGWDCNKNFYDYVGSCLDGGRN